MSADQKSIKHTGKIIAIYGPTIEILMEPQSACAGCKAKSVCGMDEDKGSIIILDDIHAGSYSVGEDVIVSMKQSMGLKAVMYIYMVPFILLLGMVIILLQLGLGELFSGLISLAIVAIYYFILYLHRRKIEKEINFVIEKSDNNITL
ncbi:MAG: SoxR reducing system RseC family protein [Rikenellaceae bacterium]|nr:SoxR reducing system RseC family protein [Rikenellaceae bacterium]